MLLKDPLRVVPQVTAVCVCLSDSVKEGQYSVGERIKYLTVCVYLYLTQEQTFKAGGCQVQSVSML